MGLLRAGEVAVKYEKEAGGLYQTDTSALLVREVNHGAEKGGKEENEDRLDQGTPSDILLKYVALSTTSCI